MIACQSAGSILRCDTMRGDDVPIFKARSLDHFRMWMWGADITTRHQTQNTEQTETESHAFAAERVHCRTDLTANKLQYITTAIRSCQRQQPTSPSAIPPDGYIYSSQYPPTMASLTSIKSQSKHPHNFQPLPHNQHHHDRQHQPRQLRQPQQRRGEKHRFQRRPDRHREQRVREHGHG